MARHGRGIMQSEADKEDNTVIPKNEPLKPWQKAVAARKANIEARKKAQRG